MAAGQSKLEEQLAELSSDADATFDSGRFAEAEAQFRKLVQLQRRALGPEHVATLRSLIIQSIALDKLERYTEEDAILREVLQVQQQDPSFGMEHEATLVTVNLLGDCLIKQRRYKEAEPMLRSVYALNTRVLGPRHVETLKIQMTLGNCLYEDNQLGEAERLLRDALQGFQILDNNPSGQPDFVKTSLVGQGMRELACCMFKAGKQQEGESLLREAVRYTRHHLGEASRLTVDIMGWHAGMLSDMGKHAAAEVMYKLAVQGKSAAYGWESEKAMVLTYKYMGCLLDQHKMPAAEALIRDTLSRLQQALEEDHPTLVGCMEVAGQFLQRHPQASKRNEAEALLRRARELKRDRQG